MAKTTAQFILERVHGWGVGHVFAYPGDGINSFLGGFESMKGRLEFKAAAVAGVAVAGDAVVWGLRRGLG